MSVVKHYQPQQSLQLNLTAAAISHIKRYIAKNACKGIEFSVDKTGCSGYAYVINMLDDIPTAHEHCEVEGISIYVPSQYLATFQGVTVDYVKEGLNEKFVFDNPNESGRCGCGESFTID